MPNYLECSTLARTEEAHAPAPAYFSELLQLISILNYIITFSRILNLYSSSGGKKPSRFKCACKSSKIFEIMYSLCSVCAGNAHD